MKQTKRSWGIDYDKVSKKCDQLLDSISEEVVIEWEENDARTIESEHIELVEAEEIKQYTQAQLMRWLIDKKIDSHMIKELSSFSGARRATRERVDAIIRVFQQLWPQESWTIMTRNMIDEQIYNTIKKQTILSSISQRVWYKE